MGSPLQPARRPAIEKSVAASDQGLTSMEPPMVRRL
jgi:hypothetical protein